ncbi:UNVERIFIED_CONTAM: hypothetical protein RMT77_007869 [Armadillidium vulgare]
MFGAAAAGGHSAYSAAAAAAAMGLGSIQPGMPPGYPPVSSSAGLASLAAAQQAQQAQAAALASLGPSAAWWNLAGLQQMELLSRLQGGLGGYPGLHPEHLMNLEILQAQHAAAMAAALSVSNKSSSSTSRTSSNGSTSSSGSATLKQGSRGSGGSSGSSGVGGGGSRSSQSSSSRDSRSRDLPSSRSTFGSSLSTRLESENNRLTPRASSSSSHHSSDSGISVRSDLGSASGSLSYGIASLMADKMPSSHKSSHRSTPSSTASDVIRNKELEIIPISPSMPQGSGISKDNASSKGLFHQSERGHHHSDSPTKRLLQSESLSSASRGSLFSQSPDVTPKVSISSLTNGLPGTLSTPPPSVWKDENPNVSIEPCSGSTPPEDAPLNLSLKSGSSTKQEKNEKRVTKESSSADLLSKLKPPLNPFDYTQSLGLGMSLMAPDMNPSLEVLQSLYGHHTEPRDVLASMQEALQRQLMVADSKKREEKKKRSRNNSSFQSLLVSRNSLSIDQCLSPDFSLDEGPEKVRHLGRGVSKPKKNTVASLLEHCRAAGIKPQLPLPPPPAPLPPPTTSLATTPITTSPPLSTQSLPPSLIPIFPPSTPSVSISPFPPPPSTTTTSSSSASSPVSLPPLSLPPSLSISSISSPKPSSPAPLGGSSTPSVTLQPASSATPRPQNKESSDDNWVEITPVSAPSQSSSQDDRKRHLTSTPGLEGRLSTSSIRSALAYDYQEMSDSDSDDSTSISSMDEESAHAYPSPWLKLDPTDAVHSGSPPMKKRKMITDERSLRVPLLFGWRRETTMRGITQSGVRGEVIYYAPCGKPFKQYPDIIRYLERQNIAEVTRDNFSFSSKITVGEYVDANTQQRYSEQEIRDIVREIRVKKGLRVQQQQQQQQQQAKKQESSSSTSSTSLNTTPKLSSLQAKEAEASLEAEAEAILRRLEAEEKAKKAKQETLSKIEEQRNIRAWKEQEKIKKQEELRKEKEEQRKQREELNRQRLYEQLKKAQEREQEKQKQKILKEQLYLQELTKQREMLYTLELERERRRYHGILVRTLEARKRYEEREKRREYLREEKRVFKEKKKEERLAARELTLLLKEVKEDMELTDHQPLPDIPPVAGMRLPPEAFGNVLMIFEFLHNFGETLGFDMESLPSLHSLQLAFLSDSESEEELLSVLTHLLVCAIEDPGIPNAQRNTTILGQTLNRADITHTNISEILRVYLYANATGEVRTVYGLQGTEKEKRETPAKAQEWDSRMNENEAYKMSLWLQKVPFLAMNPTQKTEIIGYVCHELLQNKAVIKQIEDSLDKHNGLKTEKWKLDARIRKLRMSVARKRIYTTAMRNMSEVHRDDSNMSTMSGMSTSMWDVEKSGTDKKEESKMKEEEEDEDEDENENESGNESDAPEESHSTAAYEEEDKNLNADEANSALENLQKQMDQVRQQLFETSQQVRGYNGGQDRYQRTLWILPHAGGPFMEGINSCDYVGRSHFPVEVPSPIPREGLSLEEVNASCKNLKKEDDSEEKSQIKMETDDKRDVKMEVDIVIGEKVSEVKSEIDEKKPLEIKIEQKLVNGDNTEPDKVIKDENVKPKIEEESVKPGDSTNGISSKSVNDTDNGKVGSSDPVCKTPDSNTSQQNIVKVGENHTTANHASKDSSLVDAVDKDLVATGLGLIPGQYLRPEHVSQCEKLTFSLLPRIPCNPMTLSCQPSNNNNNHNNNNSNNNSNNNNNNNNGSSSSNNNSNTPIGTPKGGSESPLLHPNSPFLSSNGSTPLSSLTPILQNSLVSNNMSHQELLEKLHQTAEALPIPPEYKTGWWHFKNFETLQEMITTLNERGARERELRRFLERNINIIKNTLAKVDQETTSLENISEEEKVFYDSFGFPTQDEPYHWSLDIALKVDLMSLEAIYALEEKITNASMQNKNWRLNEGNERPQYDFSSSSVSEEGRKNPIHIGRELLLNLEEGIERRYLKPPLGVLPTPKNENGVEPKNVTDSPKGLGNWREAVMKCETAAQLAMCTYMLETAVAWDRSIMKASFCFQFCQFCHSGDFEEKLLLCDGCDRGYHTHCFKPPMNTIPDGDWYCYECVNKFSDGSQRHCLVCGGIEGRTLVHCASCPRAYHTSCINPPLTKVPRNKWNCPACSSKSPRGRRGRSKKTPDGGSAPSTPVNQSKTSSPTDLGTSNSVNQTNSTSLSLPNLQSNCASPPPNTATESIETPATPGGVEPLSLSNNSPTHPSSASLPPSPQNNNNNVISCTPAPVSTPPTPVSITTSNAIPNTTPNGNVASSAPSLPNSNTISNASKKERGLKKKDLRDLTLCKVIQKELMSHEDAWPFLLPVNTRQFPTYKKIIKKPIDLSTINKRLEDTFYKSKEDYSEDLHLMFNNCETFNEDDSPVGKAGHNLRSFFEAKWNESFLPT